MKKLLFVYNADSGLRSFVIDAAHRIFSPATYPCNLCAITYTPRALPRWRRYVKNFPWPVEFLHRDELAEQYGSTEAALPAAFIWDGQELELWINAEEMKACLTLDDLINLVEARAQLLIHTGNPVSDT